MSAMKLQRPQFHEGQILASDDLSRLLEYPRDQDARHERYLHSWGIADGLGVVNQGDDFVLQPGFAIDSSGAPIIVAKSVVLDPQQLKEEALLSADDKGHFPVFIARTEEEQADSQQVERCSTGSATRKSEKFAIRFRRIATGWDENQDSSAVTDGPMDALESNRVVLVGFLEWSDEAGGKIVGFNRRNNGIRPRYAGVRADDILGRGGTLTLRSRASSTTDAPMVVVDNHSDKKTFVLGLDDGTGRINEVFSVDAKGNVSAKGDIKADGALTGTIKSGDILIESGLACDGLTLPLPFGINEQQVQDGSVVLHVTVTPQINWSNQPDVGWGPFVLECNVDSDRRVCCITRWIKFTGGINAQFDVTDSVNYVIAATVPGEDS